MILVAADRKKIVEGRTFDMPGIGMCGSVELAKINSFAKKRRYEEGENIDIGIAKK